MKVLVLGAPADQGVPLVRALLAAGHEVTAGARRAEALRATPFPDLPVRHADLTEPATLMAALAGQDAVAFHLPFEFDRARAAGYGEAIADAVRATGVQRVVFNTACFVADRDLGLSAHDGRRDIERALLASGATCRFVEPVVFMDNIVRPWSKPSIVERGVFAYPAAPGLAISWVCIDDVADAMVAALERPHDHPVHIALGGPEALTGDETAARLASAIGRPIRFVSLAPDDFAAEMSALVTGSRAVAPHSIYGGMARFYRWYNEQPASPLIVDPALSRAALGRPPTSLAQWAARQGWG